MKLYFSNIAQADQPQPSSRFSLGGFISSSPVSSGKINSIFQDVSQYTIEKDRKEYIFLILKNTLEQEVTNVQLWLEQEEDAQCKFRFGLSRANSKGEFEAIPDTYSKPMYAEFSTANGITDSIQLPDMNVGDTIGIWIERSINQESEEIKNRNDCDWLYEHKDDKKNIIETNQFKISWE